MLAWISPFYLPRSASLIIQPGAWLTGLWEVWTAFTLTWTSCGVRKTLMTGHVDPNQSQPAQGVRQSSLAELSQVSFSLCG